MVSHLSGITFADIPHLMLHGSRKKRNFARRTEHAAAKRKNMNKRMKIKITAAAMAFAAVLTLASCGGKAYDEKAQEWLEKAQAAAGRGDYQTALSAIDSIRENYPKAIEARKAGLRLLQKVSKEQAQAHIAVVDRQLQKVSAEYDSVRTGVERLRRSGDATGEQLTRMNLLRVRRDSLQTVFDVECAKVRYINAKMNETGR